MGYLWAIYRLRMESFGDLVSSTSRLDCLCNTYSFWTTYGDIYNAPPTVYLSNIDYIQTSDRACIHYRCIAYGLPMDYLWTVSGLHMEYLWTVSRLPINYTCGVPMDYLWLTYRLHIDHRLITYGLPVGYPWTFCWHLLDYLQITDGLGMGHLWTTQRLPIDSL